MKYNRKRYPDGSVYAEIIDFNDRIIFEKINNYEDLFFIASLKDICDYNNFTDVELFIPCMFQQQHDRRFNENESFELKLVANFINSLNFRKVYIFHPHSDATQIVINNCHVVDNSKFIQKVLKQIPSTPILLSTDGGSYKWINKLADKLEFNGEVYGASKSRDLVSHKLTQVIDRQDFQGKDVLICDDLCVFGGTFIGLAKMLKNRNIGNLYLAVSHITVVNPNLELSDYYTNVFSTNSKYDAYTLPNLKLIDYKTLI